jgi:hypothetical protein
MGGGRLYFGNCACERRSPYRCVSDHLLEGAAVNALQIAEALVGVKAKISGIRRSGSPRKTTFP